MVLWTIEPRWVSEDGLRSYLTFTDYRTGPSRLECYRRLLSEPDSTDATGRVPLLAGARLRMATVLNFVRGGWRGYPAAIVSVLRFLEQC